MLFRSVQVFDAEALAAGVSGIIAQAAQLPARGEPRHEGDDILVCAVVPAAIAGRFLNVPYYWGGKTFHGLDCSGLVQLSLQACGIAAPRDSDMLAALGDPVALDGPAPFSRGDLVFWKGHVGIMVDSVLMVHANAHHMLVAIEPRP